MAMSDALARNIACLVLEVVYLVGLLWNVSGELAKMGDHAAVLLLVTVLQVVVLVSVITLSELLVPAPSYRHLNLGMGGAGRGWEGLEGDGRCWKGMGGAGRGWEGMEGDGRVWKGMGGAGRGWEGLEGDGRGWKGMGGSGRAWEGLEGDGRVWMVMRGSACPYEQDKEWPSEKGVDGRDERSKAQRGVGRHEGEMGRQRKEVGHMKGGGACRERWWEA
ncbi:unnamed protein product [Closterium sp. NIES-65]|nr:unnamed protein product [Closterium sp. NIES-65]CAI5959851.1 unnamed protein product [Closterium sp. NIES-65]